MIEIRMWLSVEGRKNRLGRGIKGDGNVLYLVWVVRPEDSMRKAFGIEIMFKS